MTRITEKELAERFKDREGMLEALRQAGRLARLRREMWARFRASIDSESTQSPTDTAPAADDASRD